jgi:hypothetical protein
VKPTTTVLGVALMAILFVAAFPSQAHASCDPGRANQTGIWFAGTIKTPSQVPRDISALIEEYNPHWEIDAATTVWDMMNSGGSKWAQVGYWKDGSGRSAFVQWTDNSGHWFTEHFAASPVGESRTYETIYNPAAGGAQSEFVFERNNSVLWRVSPTLWQPNTVQVNGETHNRANQMPGGFNATVWLEQVRYSVGGGWININSPVSITDPNIHFASKESSSFYRIWDWACAT